LENTVQPYGKEFVLDLHGCDISRMNRDGLKLYLDHLCKLIGMEQCGLHFWEEEYIPKEEWDSNPHLQGLSAIQFIKTSSIVVHAIYGMERFYLNCFSCKDFDEKLTTEYTLSFFGGKVVNYKSLERI